jgi:uncharacterized protein
MPGGEAIASMNPTIEKLLQSRKLAVVGASTDTKSFGNTVYRELKGRGFELVPVNPRYAEVNGDKCYRSLTDLPSHIDSALFVLAPKAAVSAVAEARAAGIKYIWFQQMAEYASAVKAAEEVGIETVSKRCILMYAQPVTGFHSFHRLVNRLVGKL